MKKQCFSYLILFTIIVNLIPTNCAMAENQRKPIQEICQMTQPDWEADCATASRNTIHIKTKVNVPNVEKLPVLLVLRHRKLSDIFFSDYDDPEIYISRYGDNTLTLGYKYDFDIPDRFNPVRVDFNMKYYYPSTVHVNGEPQIDGDSHAKDNVYSAQEAYDYLLDKYQTVMRTYGIREEAYDFKPQYMNTLGLYYDGKQIIDHEGYEFFGRQVLHGIGIAGNISHIYYNYMNRRSYGFEGIYENKIDLAFSSPESYWLIAMLWEETGVLYDDIHILSFDEIKPSLEELIIQDHIVEIYEVELSYLAYYNEVRDGKKGMILVPTWVIHSQYKFKPDDINRGDEDVFHNSGYQMLAINAQTGELYDLLRTDKSRSDCPKIIVPLIE